MGRCDTYFHASALRTAHAHDARDKRTPLTHVEHSRVLPNPRDGHLYSRCGPRNAALRAWSVANSSRGVQACRLCSLGCLRQTPRRQSTAALTHRTCYTAALLRRRKTGTKERGTRRKLRRVDSCLPLFGEARAPATCLAVAIRARGITQMRLKARDGGSGGRAAGK